MKTESRDGAVKAIHYVLLEAAAEFLSGLLGIGGGVILVPALVLLAGLPAKIYQTVTTER
jgi:uncharacterized membrane protein YfcA